MDRVAVDMKFPIHIHRFCVDIHGIHGYIHIHRSRCCMDVSSDCPQSLVGFYRAMHFSAKRGIAIACRLSVCPSVRLSVCDVGEL